MCISVHMSDFEKALLARKLTKGMLDNWLAEQVENREYKNSYAFFHKFGLHLGLDRQVHVEKIPYAIYVASEHFYRTVYTLVADPTDRVFGAARERLWTPDSSLDLIPA